MHNSDIYSPDFIHHMTKMFPDTENWFNQPLREDGIDVEGLAKAMGLNIAIGDNLNEQHTDELLVDHTINIPSDADTFHRLFLISKAIGLLVNLSE